MHDALVPTHAAADVDKHHGLAVVVLRADERGDRELARPAERAAREAVDAALGREVQVRPGLVPVRGVRARAGGGEGGERLERVVEGGDVRDVLRVLGVQGRGRGCMQRRRWWCTPKERAMSSERSGAPTWT